MPMARNPTDPKTKPQTAEPVDDTAMLSLSRTDRKQLNMDSWEPSLLRKLLKAQNRLKKRDRKS
jgi:hypothetical protein